MTHHDPAADEREQISRMEAIAYIASMLPDLAVLAASQPMLQGLLNAAHTEAVMVLSNHVDKSLWPGMPPGDATH